MTLHLPPVIGSSPTPLAGGVDTLRVTSVAR